MRKLKLTGKYEEVKAELEGRLLAGPDGKSLQVEAVEYGETKDGDAVIDFVCEVSTLKSSITDDFEPVETETVKATMTLSTKNSQQMTLDFISNALGLTGDDRLKDDGEDWMRIVAADHPRTVYDKLVQKPLNELYIKCKVNPSPDGQDVKSIYFNLFTKPLRVKAGGKGTSFADLKKRHGKGDETVPGF